MLFREYWYFSLITTTCHVNACLCIHSQHALLLKVSLLSFIATHPFHAFQTEQWSVDFMMARVIFYALSTMGQSLMPHTAWITEQRQCQIHHHSHNDFWSTLIFKTNSPILFQFWRGGKMHTETVIKVYEICAQHMILYAYIMFILHG